jgi:universal stress protein A
MVKSGAIKPLEEFRSTVMSQGKILFPTDFSHTGDAALALAVSLARERGAKLLIVHVEEPPAAYGGGEMYYGLPDPATEDLERMLKEVVPSDPQVGYEHRLVTGDPATAIPRVAEEDDVDLIVMGTHGRTGLMRLLMGSVAEAVVRRAPCPVLVYKPMRHHPPAEKG